MNTSPRLRLNSKGFSLVELMVSVAIIAVIGPIVAQLFIKVSEGMASDEMHTQIQKLNELTMLRLHERLDTSKHFFQNDAVGPVFLDRAIQGLSASVPPILANSVLPKNQVLTSTGSFSPSQADPTAFGNSMFFAAYDTPATINGKAYTAPLTVQSNGSNSVVYQNGNPAVFVVDLYRFYYYYLTSSNPGGLTDEPTYRLVEWRSAQYADAAEINSISDSTLRKDVIKWLTHAGNASPANPTYAITLAWDHTVTDPTLAFYTLSGTTATLVPAASIVESDWSYVTHVSGGILSGGFKYGVCGNTAGWKSTPPKEKVPYYATANNPFPGGFEVGMSGSNVGAEVMVRSFLVAKGYAPSVIYSDITTVNSIRDVW